MAWSAFEWKFFNQDRLRLQDGLTLPEKIDRYVVTAVERGLNIEPLQQQINHFSERYIRGRALDELRLSDVQLSRADRELLLDVLNGDRHGSRDVVGALLKLVAQIRHLTIHGAKWAEGLNEYADNFFHCTDILIFVIEGVEVRIAD
ncbi:MAG: hypothetical protein RID96_28185 [Nitratireductor sp.]